MITHIEDRTLLNEAGILTFEVDGKVDKVSFINTMRKVLSEMETSEGVSLCIRVSSIQGVTLDALWEGLKFALTSLQEFLSQVNRIAWVTDKQWLAVVANVEDKLLPGIDEQVFPFEQEEDAIAWLKQG
ncbi:MAG: STAS/SEC14 domain-containing protein [Imperialibacter sp.]|uniref:STAS/SEC14 domain-containing protein n=1 Tax=Imperialibacter sp. TaxID=2038411 RepID=UPI0032EECCDE